MLHFLIIFNLYGFSFFYVNDIVRIYCFAFGPGCSGADVFIAEFLFFFVIIDDRISFVFIDLPDSKFIQLLFELL